MECWSSYDPSAWEPQIKSLDSAIQLGFDMMIPSLLLCLIGSFLPSPSSIGADEIPSFLVQKSIVDVFSPYTSALASLQFATSSATIQSSFLPNFDVPHFLRLITLAIISPVASDVLLNRIAPILLQVFLRLKMVLVSRKGPDGSTKAALMERVRIGRAIRRHAYDLYLPSTTNDNAKGGGRITSLLLFPGFGIHHSAYADIAGRISDDGIPVAVVSLEPLRLAHTSLGGSMDDVRSLINSAGKEISKYYKCMQRQINDGKKISVSSREIDNAVVEWALGGHSMGGYNALQLAEELIGADPPSIQLLGGSISKIGRKIVVWAAGTALESVPNLEDTGSLSQLRILILLASNDNIAKFSSQQQKQQLLWKLPKTTRLETIQGANHSGFASYDAANKKSNDFLNGQRGITLEAQHKVVSKLTSRFLLD